ncbi:MAG: NAD-dependent epimerase/dehydratase family protein [Pseudomonadota bacterium]
MRILIFGATGMVGQGVLRECLEADDVTRVAAIGRSSTDMTHERLTEIVTPDLANLEPIRDQLAPFDACFFCLGISSLGMKEPEYTRVTFDLTLNIARLLVRENPQMVFTYVSGAGTDSTGNGKLMWARVKGRTENALIALGFKAAYMFRPGIIQPLHAVRSKTAAYRVTYDLARPLFALIRAIWPRAIVTSAEVGRGMLGVARRGFPRAILEASDIQDAARPDAS